MQQEQLDELADAAQELRAIGMFMLARTVDEAREQLADAQKEQEPHGVQ